MDIDLIYERNLAHWGLTTKDLPRNIVGMINKHKQIIKNAGTDEQKIIAANTYAAEIADEINNFGEREYEEETLNTNNMLTDEQKKRAAELGLPDTATTEDLAAKEIEVAEAAAKEAAEAEEKAKADAEAAAKASEKTPEELAAEKLAAEKSAADNEAAEQDRLAKETAAAKRRADHDNSALGAIGL